MKFSMFNPSPVYGVDEMGGWPISPGLSEIGDTQNGLQCSIEISRLADQVGFDYITLAEHHYHPRQMSPNPMLLGAALAQHLSRAGIAILGANLPLVNPIRTAEEIAILDSMTGGKLLVGLFRGTPTEYLTYSTNPGETREVFEEAVELMIEAWTQPEPFSWVGRHYDFRVVAVWPRPLTKPHPAILVSANSEASATHAARHRFKVGIAFQPVGRVTGLASFYMEEAARFGWTPEPEDVLYRSFCMVADTDAEADRIAAQYGFGDMSKVFQSDNKVVSAELRRAMSSPAAPNGGPPVGGAPKGGRPPFIGSPETVARQLAEFSEQTGVGHFDLLFNDVCLPFEHALRGVELFGTEVLPRLAKQPVAA